MSHSLCDIVTTYIIYTQYTVKLRPNSEKIAQLKCTTNEKRNLSEHDGKKGVPMSVRYEVS